MENFNKDVVAKYQIYNSLFLTLPFKDVANTAVILPLLSSHCEQGFENGKNPRQIIDDFFSQHTGLKTEKEKIDVLFRFIQFIERQVVLFDSIEDAAFSDVNDIEGIGSLRYLFTETLQKKRVDQLKKKLEDFKVRLVLTAHPTQFYPGAVLGIITDLAQAIKENDLTSINLLLQQLGKTPFFKKEQPSPYDEAISLIWYLENIFYKAIGNIYQEIKSHIPEDGESVNVNNIFDLGFWPGGDRDGNPYVDAETSLRVADSLRVAVLKCYSRDLRKLRRRLTFRKVDKITAELEEKMYEISFLQKDPSILPTDELFNKLHEIRDIIEKQHNSLFVEQLDNLIDKVRLFGYHFATLDIRQDSRIHHQVLMNIIHQYKKNTGNDLLPEDFGELPAEQQISLLAEVEGNLNPDIFDDKITRDTLESIYAIKTIQQKNGERGANRYVISNCQSVLNVMEIYAMIRLCGWSREEVKIDIIPLFETVDDLINAPAIMEELYGNPHYAGHLRRRGNRQTIMLGFSDGTKDGGYLMANWAIYKAKEALSAVSYKYGVKVVYFDGRGGPPARGGGKTHKFYSSMGTEIESAEIQLTVQGQTISSNFGTIESAQFNMEQLLTAGISNELFADTKYQLSEEDKQLLEELAGLAYESYKELKAHPKFIEYLVKIGTLKYYGKTNIGSRPTSRKKSDVFKFEDLRAIPFVGSWSQLKQNVPGFYGVGTALAKFEEMGKMEAAGRLYKKSEFFRTLIENSMMSMSKSYFPLTHYLENDKEYGEFWQKLYHEFKLTRKYALEISGSKALMDSYPVERASIKIRERIVLPLLTIQQYALNRLHELENRKDNGKEAGALRETYEKMVTRSLYGNINAARNSA